MGQHKANVCHTSPITVEILLFRADSMQAPHSGYISIYKKKIPVPKAIQLQQLYWQMSTVYIPSAEGDNRRMSKIQPNLQKKILSFTKHLNFERWDFPQL